MVYKVKELYRAACEHTGFLRYLKNTSWLFGGQIIQMALGLFVSVAVARYLGPADFGLYSFVLSVVALVGVLGQLGLCELAKRELVESPDRRDEIMGTCFVLNLLAGGVIYLSMLVIVGSQTDRSLVLGLFALLGSSLILTPVGCIQLWFQAQVRSDLSVMATSISVAIFAVFKILAIKQSVSLIVFGYLFLLETFTLCILQIYFYRKHFGSLLKWKYNWTVAFEFLKQSWPLILSGLAIAVYMRIDQIMLGVMLDETSVGTYSVAVRISSVWYFIPSILATSLFPAILAARRGGAMHYEYRLQNYFDLNAGLAYLVCVPISVASPWIVAILFGSDYTAAAPILAIHAWSSLFVFMGGARGRYLVAEKLFKISMYCTISGAIVNLILNFLLIPYAGGVGAAISTLVSYAIAGFFSSFFIPGTRIVAKMQFKSLLFPLKIFRVFQGLNFR